MLDTLEAMALRRELTSSRMKARVPDPQAQRGVLAAAPVPARPRSRDVPGLAARVRVLPRARPAAAAAGELQEGQPDARRLRQGHRRAVRARRAGAAAGRDGQGLGAPRRLPRLGVLLRLRRRAAAVGVAAWPRPPGSRRWRDRPNCWGTTRLLRYAREALGAFRTAPPTGVATRGPLGGTHYLQYSFAPRLYILNAFLQSVIGLLDYARDHRRRRGARALRGRRARGARGGAAATTPATGRSTPIAAATRHPSTTSSCASSCRACATGYGARSTATPRTASRSTPSSRRSWSCSGPSWSREARGPGCASRSPSSRPFRSRSRATDARPWTGWPPSGAARATFSWRPRAAGVYIDSPCCEGAAHGPRPARERERPGGVLPAGLSRAAPHGRAAGAQ